MESMTPRHSLGLDYQYACAQESVLKTKKIQDVVVEQYLVLVVA